MGLLRDYMASALPHKTGTMACDIKASMGVLYLVSEKVLL